MRALVLAALLAAGSAVAQDTTHWGNSGNWEILVDPSQGNGCFAYVGYDDSSFFRAGYDMRDVTNYVFFGNPNWTSLKPGNSYTVRMYFDPQNSSWDAEALAQEFGDGTLFLRFGSSDKTLIKDIMKADLARVEYNGKEIASYDLTGSTKAMLFMDDCQDEQTAADPFQGTASGDVGANTVVTDPFAN